MEGARVEELLLDRERFWRDPYAANQRLRKTFRVERKIRHRKEEERDRLRERLGLSIDLLDETEEDGVRARLVDYGASATADDDSELERRAVGRELFPTASNTAAGLRWESQLQKHRLLEHCGPSRLLLL